MKKIVALLVLGSLFLGTGLSVAASAGEPDLDGEIGRASCRERV